VPVVAARAAQPKGAQRLRELVRRTTGRRATSARRPAVPRRRPPRT
jgi:hypothetical protein